MEALRYLVRQTSPVVVMYTPWPMLGLAYELYEENLALKDQVDQQKSLIDKLQAKLNEDSTTSNKPPSSDNPYKKAKKERKTTRKPKPPRKGHRQQCMRPTAVTEILPEGCACGCNHLEDPEPYYIHQHIELPVIQPSVEHIILYRGRCTSCGKFSKAVIPYPKRTGFGPRFAAAVVELCGIHGDSRRAVQDYCQSVFSVPISQGGIQKIVDRASEAIKPHYDAIDEVAHNERVNHIDETSWRNCSNLAWLWVMVGPVVAFFMIHKHRSKEAFEALVKGWQGILVSDGYALYQKWVNLRQTCLAHLIRKARALSMRADPELAKCGAWTMRELQRLCQMANAPPTRGEWLAFNARLFRLTQMYSDRDDDAGRLVRQLLREMDSLWVFLHEKGVAPTNNLAERMLRFAVLWRRRSLGTASEKGDRWVERILSLRQTCRIQKRLTYPELVKAIEAYLNGDQADVEWIRKLGRRGV